MKEKKEVLLLGSYSGNNLGDLGILKSIVKNMPRNFFFYIPTKYPKKLANYIEKKKCLFF